MRAIGFAVVAGLALSGPALSSPAFAKTPDSWAYVVLGQNKGGATVAMVRVAIDAAGQTCPTLTATGQPSIAMTARANPSATNFPVTVCEALLPDGVAYAVGSVGLPTVSTGKTPGRVVVLGDSGCKNDSKQSCDQQSAWPFQDIAKVAAGEKPDLLIHVGDYNYRGTPSKITVNGVAVRTYDAGDVDNEPGTPPPPPTPYWSQNQIGSSVPDAWHAWKKDFFEPASAVLTAGPWIFTRGNHELCSRAGPGYLFLLDPGSSLPGMGGQNACPNQNYVAGGPSPLLFEAPYRVALGQQAFAVIDTVNADDSGVSYTGVYNPQMKALVAAIRSSKIPTWVVTHRPFWGIENGGGGSPAIINQTLQAALAAASGAGFPPNVTLVVSGHMHRFQAMGFVPPAGSKATQPKQLIVGTGGVRLDKLFPPQNGNTPFSVPVGSFTASGVGLSSFGLMSFQLGAGGSWTGVFKDRKGAQLATCGSGTPSACTLP